MMTRIQVKCRRCRMPLLSEEAIVNSHGAAVHGTVHDWDCGSQADPSWRQTHLFLSSDLGPHWVMDAIVQSHYTQGKILCPKCQGRLGSFNFLKTMRRCSCGETTQPPIHLLCNRVDVFDASKQASPATDQLQYVKRAGGNPLAGDENLPESESPGTLHTVDGRPGLKRQSSVRVDDGESGSWDLQWLFGEHVDESLAELGDDSEHYGRDDLMSGPEGRDDPTSSPDGCHQLTSSPDGGDSVSSPDGHDDLTSSPDGLDDLTSHAEGRNDSSSPEGRDDPITEISPTSSASGSTSRWKPAPKTTSLGADVTWEVRSPRVNILALLSGDTDAADVTQVTQVCAGVSRSSRKERRRGGGERAHSKGSDRSGSPREPDEAQPQDTTREAGKKKKQLGRSPVDREREKREREEELEQSLQREVVQWEHTCPMCLEVMLSPHSTLPCRHNFCEGCLRRLTTINSAINSKCPLCRQTITKCVRNKDMDKAISEEYPIHLKVRRRQMKRTNQRATNLPLPGMGFQRRCLSRLPPRMIPLRQASRTKVAFVIFNVFLVVALSYVGMGICRRVLTFVAAVFDGVMERLTGEKLWSEFMGLESRIRTVSCVFVLYLVCACMVKYWRIFTAIQQ